tara:strand:- start:155 stop:1333 length:1179 start_codon:yes stop_codon:yes gene_type:complete
LNKNVLTTAVQDFITENWNVDIMSVLLKKPFFEGISNAELAQQIEARKRCSKKLPTWYATSLIYYPDKRNVEQTSSEKTAAYKAQLVSGDTMIDLSGGFGVDTFYFSQKMAHVVHCEIDKELSGIAAHNFTVLGASNIACIAADGLEYLKQEESRYDWAYVDPSRRNEAKGKVFKLSDCSPNILDHIVDIFNKTDKLLVKTAPLLDLSIGIAEFPSVKEIHIVAIDNEVKELLWVLEKDYSGDIDLKSINLGKGNMQIFNFTPLMEKEAEPNYALPMKILYEPNAAIMKSGAFKLVGNRFQLHKLAPNSHLYTSEMPVNFPGRVFKIDKWIPYHKKTLRKLRIDKANITARNFPESVASIRMKNRIRDGGDLYLFFTKTDGEKPIVVFCSKI